MIFTQLDLKLLLLLQNFHNKFLDYLSLGISWITEGGFIWFFICGLIFLFEKKEKKRKIFLILSVLLLSDWLVNIPFKMILFCRERPYKVIPGIRVIGKIWENCSFPSGHLAVSTAAVLIIGYLFHLRKGWFIFSSISFLFLLSFARMYVGMHYLSDILGGIVIGVISALIIIYFDKQINWKF